MDPLARRSLGRTGVELTQLGYGGASIGELYTTMPEEQAVGAVRAAWDAGIRYFDTAPWYGRGLSELRIGSGLRGQPREAFVVSTKVGRWLRPPADPASYTTAPWAGGTRFEVVFDYTYDGIMRSVEQSRLRLGITRFDLAIIHDLDHVYHGSGSDFDTKFQALTSSGWRALEELKSNGEIAGIGAGINTRGMIPRFLGAVNLDFFLVAMPYTLLDQDVLDVDFPACAEQGIGFVIGSVFASGILAVGPIEGAPYGYAAAEPEILDRVRRIATVCARHDVPLAAAALQFPLGSPAVASVIPGASRPDHVARNVAAFRHPIPADLWAELKRDGLLRVDAPVPS